MGMFSKKVKSRATEVAPADAPTEAFQDGFESFSKDRSSPPLVRSTMTSEHITALPALTALPTAPRRQASGQKYPVEASRSALQRSDSSESEKKQSGFASNSANSVDSAYASMSNSTTSTSRTPSDMNEQLSVTQYPFPQTPTSSQTHTPRQEQAPAIVRPSQRSLGKQPQRNASEQPAGVMSDALARQMEARLHISSPPTPELTGGFVDKRGIVKSLAGRVMGELVEGDLFDCVRREVNSNGLIVDENGHTVGRVQFIQESGSSTPNGEEPVPDSSLNGTDILDFQPATSISRPELVTAATTSAVPSMFSYKGDVGSNNNVSSDPRNRSAPASVASSNNGGNAVLSRLQEQRQRNMMDKYGASLSSSNGQRESSSHVPGFKTGPARHDSVRQKHQSPYAYNPNSTTFNQAPAMTSVYNSESSRQRIPLTRAPSANSVISAASGSINTGYSGNQSYNSYTHNPSATSVPTRRMPSVSQRQRKYFTHAGRVTIENEREGTERVDPYRNSSPNNDESPSPPPEEQPRGRNRSVSAAPFVNLPAASPAAEPPKKSNRKSGIFGFRKDKSVAA